MISYHSLQFIVTAMNDQRVTTMVALKFYCIKNMFKFWLCMIVIVKPCFRYDPLAGLPTDTDTEQDRVIFIKSIAQFMVRSLYMYQCV